MAITKTLTTALANTLLLPGQAWWPYSLCLPLRTLALGNVLPPHSFDGWVAHIPELREQQEARVQQVAGVSDVGSWAARAGFGVACWHQQRLAAFRRAQVVEGA